MTAGDPAIRVVHLFHDLEPFEARPMFDVLTSGRSGVAASNHAISLRQTGQPRRLRRLRQDLSTADVVQCWDTPSLVAAGALGTKKILFCPQAFPRRSTLRWFRAVSAYRDVHVACSTAAMQRRFLVGGVASDRCHLTRPGVDFGRVRRRRDSDLRRRLGIADEEFVVLVPGAATEGADHRLAIWAASIVGITDPNVRVLTEGVGKLAHAVQRLAQRLGQPRLVIPASEMLDGPPTSERLLPASDAVLIAASGPVPTLPIAVCMAAALPIVSVVTPILSELLEDRHTAAMVPEPRARQLALRLITVREDSKLQWQISDQARSEAYELWPLSKSLAAWREVYEKLAK